MSGSFKQEKNVAQISLFLHGAWITEWKADDELFVETSSGVCFCFCVFLLAVALRENKLIQRKVFLSGNPLSQIFRIKKKCTHLYLSSHGIILASSGFWGRGCTNGISLLDQRTLPLTVSTGRL